MKKSNKVLLEYMKKEDLLLNYNVAKAYLKQESAVSVSGLVELILLQKYDRPWQKRIVHNAVREIHGKKNALVSIPKFNFEERVNDIISTFVHRNFDSILKERTENSLYPIGLRDIVERYEYSKI